MLLYKKLLLMTFGTTLVCMYVCMYVCHTGGKICRAVEHCKETIGVFMPEDSGHPEDLKNG